VSEPSVATEAGSVLPMRYVSVGRRFVALLIDTIVLGIAAAPFAETTHTPGYWRIELVGARAAVPFLIWLGYFVVMEGSIGATLGKLAVGVRVRDEDGSPLGWGPAFIRNLARLVDAFPYVVPYVVGAVAVWSGPTRQRLGDRWGHTVVIERDSVPTGAGAPGSPSAGRMPSTAPPPPPPPGAAPQTVPSAPPPIPPPPPVPPSG
jgi:uncharacterized RDD family membrane protein YckC